MKHKPQGTKTVRVRVGVLIDADGEYTAMGSSSFEPGVSQHLLEQLEDEHQQVSRAGYGLCHVKFLEIDMPIPNAHPINLEAQPLEEHLAATTLTDGPVLREEND